eukprot:7552736-Prorocentrum_lima.AAC.1
MTSSLVGSEMCIRDRALYSGVSQVRCQRVVLWKAQDMRQTCQLSPGPVSYTHLTLPTICSV